MNSSENNANNTKKKKREKINDIFGIIRFDESLQTLELSLKSTLTIKSQLL